MSRVYFHSPTNHVELLGRERAYASCLCNDIATGLLQLGYFRTRDQIMSLVSAGHYLNIVTDEAWAAAFRTAFVTSDEDLLTWRGRSLSPFDFVLNTAILVGNDPLRFLARMHGQCEIHGWVDGPDRAWLAGIIRDGLASGLYRPDVGWDRVAAFLTGRDDEPVVMSFSVTDWFPNLSAADWQAALDDEDAAQEAWDELGPEQQWRFGEAWLRGAGRGLQLVPAGFDRYRFGHGLTVLDLGAADWQARLDAAAERLEARRG